MEVTGCPSDSNQMCVAYENRVFDKRDGRGGRLRCTLVTGFLGSGKTTLVRHILDHRGDLCVAVLVNEYGDIDIDSLLLNSSSINSSFDLPSVSLVNGCACCNVSGNLQKAIQKVTSSRHNFDYLVIETSGLADPVRIAKDLQGMGVQLDVIVTVVDVEVLDKVLRLPIALQQLIAADIVLVNKCDLAALGKISDVEDLIEKVTRGTKAIRCRFCKVPLDLVIDVSLPDTFSPCAATATNTTDGVLSHEAFANSLSPRSWSYRNTANADAGTLKNGKGSDTDERSIRAIERMDSAAASIDKHPTSIIFSVTFHSTTPLSMGKMQNVVTRHMFHMKGLLRAKGFLWLNESRNSRYTFHWCGKKRAEATFSGTWESPPTTSLVFIGIDKDELDILLQLFSNAHTNQQVSNFESVNSSLKEQRDKARRFAEIIALDYRFKVCESNCQSQWQGCAVAPHPYVVFGLVGSPLRGIGEADLNKALMHMVNSRGVLFLTAATSSKEDHLLQIAFDNDQPSIEDLRSELDVTATAVRSKLLKDIHPCRCDLQHHDH